MDQISYINYKDLDEFYTIAQLSTLLGISKQELKEKCGELGIKPHKNEVGDFGFVRYDVRKLRDALYHESRGGKKEDDDPWA